LKSWEFSSWTGGSKKSYEGTKQTLHLQENKQE
jgi:hypothetical protein